MIADQIQECPEIVSAKQKILKHTLKQMDKIQGIKPPDPALKQSYEHMLQEFNRFRGQNLFFPFIGSGAGRGALVELADGSIKYDCISGIGVHFGHGHPKLIESSLDAALQDTLMQGNLMQSEESVQLTRLLIQHSKLDHAILTSSGAMANENALKLLFHNKHPAHRVLAFEGCFMGRTLALSHITDKPQYREGLPAPLFVDYIPFFDWKEPEKSRESAVSTLERLLKRHPEKYACMCMELIQGENGFYPGETQFFKALIEVLKAHDIPVFVDEVQTFGRTTHLFAFQHFDLDADVVTIGKLSHVCATLYKERFRPKPGLVSQTYTSSTAAIKGALAIIKSLVHEGFLGEDGYNMQLCKYTQDRLRAISSRHPELLEGPYGKGLMIACTPYKGERKKVQDFLYRLFDAGVITFMAGQNPSRIRFLFPAGGISFQDIDIIMKIFEETL